MRWRCGHPRGRSDLRWVGYLSTTGVYGDHAGDWVDEDHALTTHRQSAGVPGSRRGGCRRSPDLPLPYLSFGRASIGPGAAAFAKVRAGTARRIIKQGQVFPASTSEDIAKRLSCHCSDPMRGLSINCATTTRARLRMCRSRSGTARPWPVPPRNPRLKEAAMTPGWPAAFLRGKQEGSVNDRTKAGVGLWVPQYPTYSIGACGID